jgi:lipopolysaccharide/colanic/teichoic acid biosynthesis glycosyltransferase
MWLIDKALAVCAAAATAPIVAVAAFAIWLEDRKSPFYFAPRVGIGGRMFRLYKLRTMIVNADATKVDTTVADDPRITRVGRIIRRFKIDELPQFWNVVVGDMVLVGPRPNVARETKIYTAEERRLLAVRPGITDLASIVFSDLAEILAGTKDPNIAYNQLVRPWKSRLALFYIDNKSALTDLVILLLTAVALLNRRWALRAVALLLEAKGASRELITVVMREQPLVPAPPPGASSVVVSRD